ncbi:hypothetical protein ACIGKQ_21110 [Gordonia sp. NPDC062954]|uniref:hypothetical protein n=1 Tax=Gordonia sp. NPDC062954 TaxID=3364003 RepID=UPI0037CA516E
MEATQIDHEWTWTTANGELLAAQPGDWRVTDPDGSIRSVSAEVFGQSYEPVGHGRFRRTGVFRAQQVITRTSINTTEGPAEARPGDWVVEGAAGEQWPVPKRKFERSYEAVYSMAPAARDLGPRWPNRFAAGVPWVLTLLSITAATWGFIVIHDAFPGASLAQQIYSTMAMFAGGYIAISNNPVYDPVPPPGLAIPSVMAFSVTIAAAGSVIVTLSTQARNTVRAMVTRPHVVVIGSGATAAAIIQSSLANGVRALLITEDRGSEAARACIHRIPSVVIRSISESGSYGATKWILRRCENVVVAAESDPVNLDLQATLSSRMATRLGARRSVISVVNDADLVDAMRPHRISSLTDEHVTCPAENVAEHVCHLIDAAATGPAAIVKTDDTGRTRPLVNRVIVQVVDVDLDHVAAVGRVSPVELVAPTISLWVKRQCWSRSFLHGNELPGQPGNNPIVPIHLEVPVEAGDLVVRVYCGRSGSHVISRYLEDCRLATPPLVDLAIVVADEQSVTTACRTFDPFGQVSTGWDWLAAGAPMTTEQVTRTTLAVDPDLTGLNVHLVNDDVRLQWARVFNQTYEFMFAGDYAINGWLPGAPLGSATKIEEARAAATVRARGGSAEEMKEARTNAQRRISNRLSSELAAKAMIEFLKPNWQLVRYDGATSDDPPPAPGFDSDLINRIAALEHNDWCKRRWYDTSRRGWRRGPTEMSCCAHSRLKLGKHTFAELEDETKKPEHQEKLPEKSYSRADELRVAINYNRRIVSETYPAIAACFGYQIVPANPPERDN